MSSIISEPTTHQSWCKDHVNPEPGIYDGFCSTGRIDVAADTTVTLLDGTLDGAPGISVFTPADAELALDDARALAETILELCGRAEPTHGATVTIEGRQTVVRDTAGMLRGSFSGSSKHGVRHITELLVVLRDEAEGQR